MEEEDWINYIKRSTAVAIEQMKNARIPCWIEMHKKMKWRLAMRIATMKNERWAKKAAEWKPGLSDKIKTQKTVGRPTKRWEDEINDFLRSEETEESRGNDLKNNDTWIKIAQNQRSWKQMESDFAAAASHRNRRCRRNRSGQQSCIPDRYINGEFVQKVKSWTSSHATRKDEVPGAALRLLEMLKKFSELGRAEGLKSTNRDTQGACHTFSTTFSRNSLDFDFDEKFPNSVSNSPQLLPVLSLLFFFCHWSPLFAIESLSFYSVAVAHLAKSARHTNSTDSFWLWSWPHPCP